MPKPKPKTHDQIRKAIARFKNSRETIADLTESNKKQQPRLIAMMQEVGVDNEVGIIVDEDDPNKGTAYVQQNNGSTVWDSEAIMDWLNHPTRKSLKRKSQSLVFDVNKWEALVASREIPAKVAKKFMTVTDPPAPFIRFGKRKDNSL